MSRPAAGPPRSSANHGLVDPDPLTARTNRPSKGDRCSHGAVAAEGWGLASKECCACKYPWYGYLVLDRTSPGGSCQQSAPTPRRGRHSLDCCRSRIVNLLAPDLENEGQERSCQHHRRPISLWWAAPIAGRGLTRSLDAATAPRPPVHEAQLEPVTALFTRPGWSTRAERAGREADIAAIGGRRQGLDPGPARRSSC
jgi:hypothetical protein